MRLALHSRYGVVGRKDFKRLDPRIPTAIVDNEWGHETCLLGHLTAGEALTAGSLKPAVRSLSAIGTRTPKFVFQALCRDSRYR